MAFLAGVIVVILSAINLSVYCEIFPQCSDVDSKTFVADLKDCQSYIYCDDEESFAAKCPINQRFNSDMGICDDQENVECFLDDSSTINFETTLNIPTTTIMTVISSSSESTATSTSVKTSSSMSSTESTPTTLSSTTIYVSSTTPSKGQIVCPTPSKPDEVFYLPNSQSCSDYWMCFRNTPIPLTCPKNLEFNKLSSSCDWPISSNCKIAGTTTTSPRELCTDHNSGYFEYPGNCHYYYRCLNGLLTIQECPSGFGWDRIQKMCSSSACRKDITSRIK